MAKQRVLLVEDDRAIRRATADALSFAGYDVVECEDGPAGLTAARSGGIDLVLLDVMLPGMDGFAVLAELRKSQPTLPVIMVTARGAEEDCISGLKGGADDYVVKPFGARELLARVEAVMRRSPARPTDVSSLSVSGREIDLERREVTLAGGERRALSDREASLLRYLATSPGRIVSRDELLRSVWGIDPRGVRTRTVDVHVARLREKLDDDPSEPKVVVTVRGKGYMLATESA